MGTHEDPTQWLRIPLDGDRLAEVPDRPGVHVVWSPDGEPLYVGFSRHTRSRLRQHLTGDREASALHAKVGRLLDEQQDHEATRDEIRDWLSRCTVAHAPTDHLEQERDRLISTLRPRFNDPAPQARLAEPTPGGSPVTAVPSTDLRELLEAAMLGIESFRTGRADAAGYRPIVEQYLPATIREALTGDFEVRGRTGTGDLADVPWVAVFPGRQTSATRGVYLAYLFCADGSATYLCLTQAAKDVQGGSPVLRKRALDLRDALGQPASFAHSIDLRSQGGLPKKYEAATALAIRYDTSQVPDSARLRDDLERMWQLLHAVPADLTSKPHREPAHLVMKWSAEQKSDTILQHQKVTDMHGSVWWGKNGNPGTTAISRSRIQEIRDQLSEGVPTHCYFYRAGEVWRTRLLALTDDPTEVEQSLLPAYYRTDMCNFFVKVTDWTSVPPDWPANHLVLASNPDPDRTPGALGNQTGPLMVYERWSTPTADSDEATPGQAVPEDEGDSPFPTREPLTIEWLASQTLLDEVWLTELLEALDRRPQVVLAGPPGTGKTWLAKAIARYLTGDQALAYRLLQFHASYGYEEFIEGLRPTAGPHGLTFARVDGAVLRMAGQIQGGSDQRHVLVLDEMNRANLPRVFGELMYLLEYRDEPADLLYSEDFTLPGQLTFIGTMNTADRSIRSLDVALRRRFEVFEVPPNSAVLAQYYEHHDCQVTNLIPGFEKLNERLTELLDRHHTVGHSFFMADPMTPKLLEATWDRQLKPLFEDYFFDQPDISDSLALEEFWPDVPHRHDH